MSNTEDFDPIGLGDLIHEMINNHQKLEDGETEVYWQNSEYFDAYLELNRLVPDVSKKKELK